MRIKKKVIAILTALLFIAPRGALSKPRITLGGDAVFSAGEVFALYDRIISLLGIDDRFDADLTINVGSAPANMIGAYYTGVYFPSRREIYVQNTDQSFYILAHELTHAIIDHYFIQDVSMEIQEIICGYVEFKMRKSDRENKNPRP